MTVVRSSFCTGCACTSVTRQHEHRAQRRGPNAVTPAAIEALNVEVARAKDIFASQTLAEREADSGCGGWRVQDVVQHGAARCSTVQHMAATFQTIVAAVAALQEAPIADTVVPLSDFVSWGTKRANRRGTSTGDVGNVRVVAVLDAINIICPRRLGELISLRCGGGAPRRPRRLRAQ